MISLAGKSALVTGGSRGIGRATALLMARAGADVGIAYRSRVADAESVEKTIRGMGRRCYLGRGDLSDPVVVDQIFRECRAAFGGLDLLVANAGIWPDQDIPLPTMTDAHWRRTMAANLDAVFYTVRSALGILRPGGSIVIVTSTAAQRGEAFHADYAASKGALQSFAKSLAVECAPTLTVNCVAPGWVATDMSADALAGEAGTKALEGIPLGRVATADDIAGPIVFLCSSLGRHITGEVLNVNGGAVRCG
jgi:3-oxoacyl-[acyl-carrier protein] reductase